MEGKVAGVAEAINLVKKDSDGYRSAFEPLWKRVEAAIENNMNSNLEKPPLLMARPAGEMGRKAAWGLLFGFSALVLAGAVAQFWSWMNWPMPVCVFKQLSGLPCAFCGSTRSLMAWVTLDWRRAFLLNPLLFALAMAMLAGTFWMGVDWVRGRKPSRLVSRILNRPGFPWGWFWTLLLLNWLYLLIFLAEQAS
jgi:hypothetical protein